MDDETRRKMLAWEKEHQAGKDAVVAEIAERMLGVRPEHGSTIYTQHPLMAGVLRQALGEAYEKGKADVAALLLKRMLEDTRKT